MPEGEIDGKVYPVAIGQNGETLWQTTAAQDAPDEVWDDWSLSMGETKRETGRGYLFSRGWDASERGALRLSPFYHNLNNTALSTDYGYFMEGVKNSGSTLTLDAAATGKGSVAAAGSLTWSHTVASQSERILIVALAVDRRVSVSQWPAFFLALYAGTLMTFLASHQGASGTDASVGLWYLLNPATGSNTVTIANGSGTTTAMVGGSQSLYGVNGDTPFGSVVSATGTDGTPTVTVTTAAGEQILATVGVEGSATIAAGTNETERWDDTQGTDVSGSGYTQAGSDGGEMAPSLTSGTEWVEIAVPIKPASTSSRSTMFVSDTTKIFQYTYDSDSGLTLDATDTTASGVAGRPTKANGNWYSPMGSGASAQKLTNVTWADVTGTWKADHLALYQKGVTPTIARVNSSTQNKVELNADTGDVTDTWTNESEAVGDSTTKITELIEAQGLLFVAKEDSLFEFGSEAESRNAIPFLDRGKIDSDNGKYSFAFGDEIVYMSKDGMWRYRIGRGALPVGANTIRSWRKIDDIIPTPKDGRHAGGVRVGEYWYVLLNEGETSHLLQIRKRREGDPAGHELIIHSVLTIPLSKGLAADSLNRLWIKGASTDETVRDIRVIELADDGSLDIQNRKGQASEVHDIYFDERNPGRPQDQVQIRHFTVELEGDWDATTSLQLKIWRDNATSATSIGDAITSAGVTIRNPTVGTNDTAYRFRPQLTLTTNSSYTPRSADPRGLRAIVGIRFPEIIRIVIPADDGVLMGMTAIDAEQNLRRLQNQGIVTFRRPGDTTTTFSAEIFSVTDTMYATLGDQYAHGIEVRCRRWVTP